MRISSAALLRALTEGVEDAVFVKDRRGRYVIINAAGARLIGKPVDEVIGHDDRALYPPESAERLMAVDRHVIDSGETAVVEERVATRLGIRTFLTTKAAYRDGDGRVAGLIGIARDMTERKRSEEEQEFLAEASRVLAGSLDQTATLRSVAQVAVPRLADRCLVDVLEDEGQLRRLAVAGLDEQALALLQEMRRRYPLDSSRPHPVLRVVRTGHSELTPEVTDADRRAVAQDDEHLEMLRRLGVTSTMCVPLIARGRVLGAITFSMTSSRRRYDERDLALAEDLARRAALAVDNARLYQESQRQAHRLGLLATASEAFAATSLDLTAVLETLARLVSEAVGDGCSIYLVHSDNRQLTLGAVYHPDPNARALALECLSSAPSRIGERIGRQIVETMEPQILAAIPPRQMREVLPPEYRPYVDRYGIHSLVATPLRSRRRPLVGIMVAWRDATKRAFTHEETLLLNDLSDRAALAIGKAELYQEAQEAIRGRDEFLSIASHELRTPVTSIKGFAQVTLRAKQMNRLDDDRLIKSLEAINRVSDRLAELIEDLLDVSRMRTERLRLSPKPINLGSFVQGLVSRYHDQMDERHRLTTSVMRTPCIVVADALRLEQVLLNLLDNAIKYSPKGGDVRVTVRSAGDEAVMSVRDQGIGIPPGATRSIFEPFGRAANAERMAIPGMGLGLYICRGIVERLGGRIWAASRGEGKGTTVSIALPRQVRRRANNHSSSGPEKAHVEARPV